MLIKKYIIFIHFYAFYLKYTLNDNDTITISVIIYIHDWVMCDYSVCNTTDCDDNDLTAVCKVSEISSGCTARDLRRSGRWSVRATDSEGGGTCSTAGHASRSRVVTSRTHASSTYSASGPTRTSTSVSSETKAKSFNVAWKRVELPEILQI